jgi:hypothetical protein
MMSPSTKSSRKDLPLLFYYMEMGDWDKASDRVRQHPKDVKTWATLRTKQSDNKVSSCKRLALHHACFKLRSAGATPVAPVASEDAFVEVCRFILMLIKIYPDAASQRETRHGCLPLHLACFASCAPRIDEAEETLRQTAAAIARPTMISDRVSSDATGNTENDNMSAVHASEQASGGMRDRNVRSSDKQVSVSMRPKNLFISAKREEMAVQVVNALLDAYPKGIRVDSEGGRLPLHTACAGRATPRVISTLVTANPSAARHRNKDGFLPLHLAAHWGVSHPSVAVILLRVYPDATLGRNRWERTPLEEALCMAGENGRPYQDALVRALRRHPTYWTRPTSELFGMTKVKQGSSNLVDIDESLPSNDSTTLEEQQYRYGSFSEK